MSDERNEIEEAITRAYDALSDVVDIADGQGWQSLLFAAERARDHVNSLTATLDATTDADS